MSELLAGDGRHYRTIVVADVASFTDPVRTELHQRVVHEGLYAVLRTAFDESGIPWAECRVDDRGDGALILVRPEFPKIALADQLPGRLLAALRRYNEAHALEARIQLRLALHAGEIHQNENGLVGQALNLAFRVVEAEPAKIALRRTESPLAMIATDDFYQEVIRQDPAAEPGSYRLIDVAVKKMRALAWLRLPGWDGAIDQPLPRKRLMFELVEALLAIPLVADDQGRRQVISLLRPEIANAVPYFPVARLHVVSLVRTCGLYDGGLDELVGAVADLNGDSPAVRQLEEIARNRLSDSLD